MKKFIRKIKIAAWELKRRNQNKNTTIDDDTIRGITRSYWRGLIDRDDAIHAFSMYYLEHDQKRYLQLWALDFEPCFNAGR